MKELDEIFSYLCAIPAYKLPEDPLRSNSIEVRRYHYIDHKAKEIARRNAEKTINNKFRYLLRMIKQDAEN